MRKKVSPTFVAAGVVVGLACFVLLSMLFYSPSDYFERASQVAGSHGGGFRFSVASTFFQPFGVAAYIAWIIILLWAVIVFFKEAVGELALRAVSLVVVVVSGASVAHLLGSEYLGGHLGYTIGSFFSTALGDTLGVVVMGGIFAVSFLLATDFGFVSYFQEARAALAEPDEETGEDGDDLVSVIERTAREVEAESEIAIEVEPELAIEKPAAPDLPPEVIVRGEDEPLRLNLRPKIEVEALDEDLLVAAPPEAETETEIEATEESEIEATEEPAIEIETGPEDEVTEEPEAEAPATIHLDDEIRFAVPEPEEDEYDALAAATADLEAALARRQESVAAPAPEVEEPDAEEATARAEEADAVAETPAPVEAAVEPEAAAEPEVAEAEPEPESEAGAGPIAVRRDMMRDLDSVFDALVGLAPSAEEPEAGETPEPEAAPAPVEAEAEPEPAPEPEPEFVEEEAAAPSFVLDDEIVMGYRAVPGEMPAEEPEEEVVEEAPAAAPAAALEPAPEPEPAPVAELESEPMEPVAEPAGPAILLDDVIVTSAGPAVEDEEPMFPFMAEERAEAPAAEAVAAEAEAPAVEEPPVETPAAATAPAEVEAPVEEEEEIPVLRDVSEEPEEASKGVFQSLFGRKKAKEGGRDRDPLLADAARLVLERGRASVVLLQRRLDIGYTRASRLVDAMEREGLVGPLEESGSRAVLLSFEEWEARLAE